VDWHAIWIDPVGSKVIAAVIGAVGCAILTQLKYNWLGRLLDKWKVKLVVTHSQPESHAGAGYPLKYYVEMRNDSSRCIEVRLSGYKPKTITLKSFPPEVMQVRFNNKWFPSDPVDRVAILPRQLCRLWIGIDEQKFNESQVRAARGSIGTLIVSAANRKHFSFEL
jgi:hypothetical protein